MTPQLYEHQKKCLEFIKDKKYFALFMEMGTGKSKIIVEQSRYLFETNKIKALVIIAPNSIKEQWLSEQFLTHYGNDNWRGFCWHGATTIREKNDFFELLYSNDNKLKVFSFNVEAFQSSHVDQFIRDIIELKDIFIICDESTKIKNGRRKGRGKRAGAIRTNKILDFFSQRDCYKAILSGTPSPRSPFDLWSQLEFLKQDFFHMDYFYFTNYFGIQIQHTNYGAAKKYYSVLCEKEYNIVKNELRKHEILDSQIIEQLAIKYGTNTKDIITINQMTQYSGYKNLDKLKEKISEITFFANKKDCLDLPDKIYETLHAEMDGEQKRIYNDLKKNLYTEYAGKELTVTNKMVLLIRLQAVTGGLFPFSETDIKLKNDEEIVDVSFHNKYIDNSIKIKVLLDDLENVPEDTHIIIWAKFRAEIELIEKSLLENDYPCQKYYGGSNDSVIDEFKQGKFQILVATPEKGGEGLNLQIATLHYYYSNGFRADSRLQSEDRSHRAGQTNKVVYKDII